MKSELQTIQKLESEICAFSGCMSTPLPAADFNTRPDRSKVKFGRRYLPLNYLHGISLLSVTYKHVRIHSNGHNEIEAVLHINSFRVYPWILHGHSDIASNR